jgi:hypothetical protein
MVVWRQHPGGRGGGAAPPLVGLAHWYGIGRRRAVVLLAYLVGTTFIKASTGLAERATALGQGQPVAPMDSQLAEFVVVGDALETASAAIEHRAQEREKSDQQRQLLINELDHRVKNTLATVQSIVQQTLRTQGAQPKPMRR